MDEPVDATKDEEKISPQRVWLDPAGQQHIFADNVRIRAGAGQVIHIMFYSDGETTAVSEDEESEAQMQVIPAYCQGAFTMPWGAFLQLEQLLTSFRKTVEEKLEKAKGSK